MRRYRKSRRCPKCHSKGADTRWFPPGEHACEEHKDRDVLARHCESCGYIWYERPLDG